MHELERQHWSFLAALLYSTTADIQKPTQNPLESKGMEKFLFTAENSDALLSRL
jgi:hypothetical protein